MSALVPLCFFDPPQVINTKVTPIPGSGSPPLQVIADTGIITGVGIVYKDGTGDFIGVYLGASGHEVLGCIIGNGDTNTAWARFPQHSRVSLRSMTPTQINNGLLSAAVVTSL